MKRILITTIVLLSLLMPSTVISMGRRGPGVAVVVTVPILPAIVELDEEPYYYQNGYHYHYNDNRWYYARSRSGPWNELPRDHYPKEVRYKKRGGGHDQGRDRDNRDRDNRNHDKRGRYDRNHDNRDRN